MKYSSFAALTHLRRRSQVLLCRRNFNGGTGGSSAPSHEGSRRLPAISPAQLSAVVFGGIACGIFGAHLWRFRWCESQLQAFAVDDREPSRSGNRDELVSCINRTVTRQSSEDAEALRKHLNDPPKGITFVESLTSRLSDHFVHSALAPRPCVTYITLDSCLLRDPDSLVKYLAESFGAYVVSSYFGIRRMLHFGPSSERVILSSIRSILEIVSGALMHLKSEYGHNYFPPAIVISGLHSLADASHIPTAAGNLSDAILNMLVNFCLEMSRMGLLHVVITQRSGCSLRTSNVIDLALLRHSDKIFSLRPMSKEEAALYLYSNIFTAHTVIPGDVLNRVKVFERGEKMHEKHADLFKNFAKSNPCQTAIVHTIAELLHSNDTVLESFIDEVHILASARAVALQASQNRADTSEPQLLQDRAPPPRETSDIITPDLMYYAYRQLLREQYKHLASTVLATFLCDEKGPKKLACYNRYNKLSETNIDTDACKYNRIGDKADDVRIDADTNTADYDELDSEETSPSGAAVQNIKRNSSAESAKDYYDHLFDAKNRSRDSIQAADESEWQNINNPPGELSNSDTQQAFVVAKNHANSNLSKGLSDRNTSSIDLLDIEIDKINRKNERIEAVKGVTSALVQLTQIPMTVSFPGVALDRNNVDINFRDVSLWQFVHDHLRGSWSILWYLIDNNIICITLPYIKSQAKDTDEKVTDVRGAAWFNQSDAPHRYVVQFASPIHHRIVENFIIDGGCDSLEDSYTFKTGRKKKAGLPQLQKHKKHKSLSSKYGSINVCGYGRGYNNELDEFQIDHIVDSTTQNTNNKFNSPKISSSIDGETRMKGVFNSLKFPPFFGSCEKFDEAYVNSNIIHGAAVPPCDSKLNYLFNNGRIIESSSLLYSLGILERSLVRACAVQMDLCEGTCPKALVGRISRKYKDSDMALTNSKQQGDPILVSSNVALAAYHLQHIASFHGSIEVTDIQEVLASQGYLHSLNRIELALDMLYLEGKLVIAKDLILLLDRLALEEKISVN